MRTALVTGGMFVGFVLMFPSHAFALTSITDCDGLGDMDNDLAEDYELSGDIDCDGVTLLPVGDASTPFTGTFDGNDYVIRNLDMVGNGAQYTGIFGYANGATISNVTIDNVSMTGSGNIGALVGFLRNGTVANAGVTDYHILADPDDSSIGGLIGAVYSGTVLRSYSASGFIESGDDRAGGLIGLLSGGLVLNAHATVTNTNTNSDAGGLVGLLFARQSTTIRNAYGSGYIMTSSRVGGVVGHMDAPAGYAGVCLLENAFAIASVDGGVAFGDLVGQKDAACDVVNAAVLSSNCVQFDSDAGSTDCTENVALEAFYDSDTEPLASWDFTSVWYERSGDLPHLRWTNAVPAALSGLAASASASDIALSWANPPDSDFASVTIRRSTSGFVSGITDGVAVRSGITGTSYTDSGLADATYYYSLFAVDTIGGVSAVATISARVLVETSVPAPSGGGGSGRSGRSPAIFSSLRQPTPHVVQKPSHVVAPKERMSQTMQTRTCDRVTKWFGGNEEMINRVNERLEKRFGFTCEG